MTGKDNKPSQYSKFVDQKKHVLQRPDTYLGSVVFKKTTQFICVKDPTLGLTVQSKEIDFNPGLERIFLEVLSNAHDNVIRSQDTKTPVKHIDVNVSDEFIEVYNDGLGIRLVEVTDENGDTIEGSIAPEVIFGELLSGSNFNDGVVRNTSGRNGYGAKITNIFSSSFHVEAYDEASGKVFKKTWSDNMAKKTDNKFSKGTGKSGWTRVKFQPDYKRFGCEKLSEDMKAYFHKLVIDVAMQQPRTRVTFNEEEISVKNLEAYSRLYVGVGAPTMTFKSEDSAVVVVDCSAKIESDKEDEEDSADRDDDDAFAEIRQALAGTHFSFVNGIYARDGGIHVDTWMETIYRPLLEKLSKSLKLVKTSRKKNSDEKLTKVEKEKEKKQATKKTWMRLNMNDVKKHLAIFIVCTLDKPTFDTQTKLKLNSPAPKTVAPSEPQITKMIKWPFRKHIEYMMHAKSLAGQKSTDATRDGWRNIDKHTRANWFRTKNAHKATLIITEGDSAKGGAISVIKALEGGNNAYGVYALRGKLLNVRAASIVDINKNNEIRDLKQILGLKHDVDYSDDKNYRTLNYGRVQIWTDQDLDGDHIKGLILNMFEVNYPSLIKRGFVTVMNTPIVIVTLKKEPIYFYEIGKFRTWFEEQTQQGVRGIQVKYFKGLGTFEKRSFQKVIKDENKVLTYTLKTKEDSESMDLAFSRFRPKDRKVWIQEYENDPIDPSVMTTMSLDNFVNRCLRSYSVSTLQRAIPSAIDGCKEGQRKIVYVCRKEGIFKSQKLPAVVADVLKHGAYHHGDSALTDTVVHMAQCWPGRNTLPLMEDDGNFGYRFTGAGNYSQARYISTCMTNISKALFRPDDDPVLSYMIDDGKPIEPTFFVPVLPLILFNNMEGIATGWNSKTPSFNPTDVIRWIRAYLRDELSEETPMLPTGQLTPWFMNFKGTVTLNEPENGALYSQDYTINGQYKHEADHIIITDLPPNVLPYKYLAFLDTLEGKKHIQKYTNHSGSDEIYIDIHCAEKKLSETELKLKSKGTFKRMVLLDRDGMPKQFHSAEELLLYWCPIRLEFYEKRKHHLIKTTKADIKLLKNKIRFITEVGDGTLVIRNRDLDDITTEMERTGYDKREDKYEYLLSMPIQSISKTRLSKLNEELSAKKKSLKHYKKNTPADFWSEDLEYFEAEYEKHVADRLEKSKEIDELPKPKTGKTKTSR